MAELQDVTCHSDLVGTAGDFSLPQSYIYVSPPLKKYKEYSCTLTTINIPKDICCGLILKDHQNEEVTEFLSAETSVSKAWSLCHAGKKVRQSQHPQIISLFIIESCRAYT